MFVKSWLAVGLARVFLWSSSSRNKCGYILRYIGSFAHSDCIDVTSANACIMTASLL